MELTDFTEFEPFNALRRQMGAEKLGFFELFDPAIHLTGEERSELENAGRLLPLEKVEVLGDKTLAIKNSRVLMYIPDESWHRSHRAYPSFHVALCETLEQCRQEDPKREYLVTTRIADDYQLLKIRPSGEVSVSEHGFVICKHCLHRLRYKNYDEYRNRRRGHSQKILSDFSLAEFFRLYKQYPLSFNAKRES